MKKNWAQQAIAVGGIAGLLGLSANLIIPMWQAAIVGADTITYHIWAWEIGFEHYLFTVMWLMGLFALIWYWRADKRYK